MSCKTPAESSMPQPQPSCYCCCVAVHYHYFWMYRWVLFRFFFRHKTTTIIYYVNCWTIYLLMLNFLSSITLFKRCSSSKYVNWFWMGKQILLIKLSNFTDSANFSSTESWKKKRNIQLKKHTQTNHETVVLWGIKLNAALTNVMIKMWIMVMDDNFFYGNALFMARFKMTIIFA